MNASSKPHRNPNDIVLDAFCGCGTALVAAENLGRQWIGIDISPTACRVMAKRLRDVCKLREDENSGVTARASSSATCRGPRNNCATIPPFEFENWAVIALGGIPNKAQVGDMGIDGRIYPRLGRPRKTQGGNGELDFMDDWYPIQVKQKDKVGRPDIDAFEAAMIRARPQEGLLRRLRLLQRRPDRDRRLLPPRAPRHLPLTVREILDEQIARKLV